MMGRILHALRTRLDALEALAGLGLITAGVAMIHVGAALIVAGAVLLAMAAWPTRRSR